MRAFTVIDWRADFIAELADMIASSGDSPRSLVVFPHMRPRRYLLRALAEHPRISKPFVPPDISTIGELTERLYFRLCENPGAPVQALERTGLLFEVVGELRAGSSGPLRDLPDDREKFFPWGLMLADLMEELFRHDKTPGALPHMDGEVLPTAATLLEHLDSIHGAYVEALRSRGWTTPGLMARFAARNATAAAEALAAKDILLCGFYALTGAEKKLFRALCDRTGARVLLHADSNLAGSDRAHWSCLEIENWAGDFGARIEATPVAEEPGGEPETRFYEAFDLHSQLKRMEKEIASARSGPTAAILPDTGSLMPVLHHLPEDADINVSMGYPLSRSPLYRLVDQVVRLQESSPELGLYYWRDVIELIRHPYLKTLTAGDGRSLRTVLGLWEKDIRASDKYLDPLGWSPDPEALQPDADPKAAADAVRDLVLRTMTSFEKLETLADLGEALLGLCQLLVPADDAPENLWQRFPIDGECLFRLVRRIVPQLTGSAFSNDSYGREILFTILRKLLEQERTPFEAEPLTGLQVMGLLETRLLKFREVHVLDATDDKLPGASDYDPLLPDPLRGLLGLPDGRQRDHVAAYNFHRLAAGAERISIYYRSGEEGPSPLSGRSVRSRFAEHLIWREEQRNGEIMKPNENGPVFPVTLKPGPLPDDEPFAPKDDSIRERIKLMLAAAPISPTMLDSYLTCQLKFFYERVARLTPVEEVTEELDNAELGKLVHDVLHRFFAPHLGREVVPAELDPGPLLEDFSRSLQTSDFYRRMPLDQRMAVERAGVVRLGKFLENSKQPTTILGLERKYRTTLSTEVGDFVLGGRMDRVDRREDGDHVLDYKTGSPPSSKDGFLENDILLARLREWRPGEDPDAIRDLSEAAGSIQLPVYLYVYARGAEAEPANAAWVALKDKGDEKRLFRDEVSAERRHRAVHEATPEVVSFIIKHMVTAGRLSALPGKHCEWCPFKGGCPGQGA